MIRPNPEKRRGRLSLPAPVLALAAGLALARAGAGQEAAPAAEPAHDERFGLHFQLTTVTQAHPAFDAAYSGRNSLSPDSEHETTVTSTLAAGARLTRGTEIYVDGELSGGSGLSHALGVAGFPNGESFRVGDAQPRIYLARAFLRQTIAAGEETESVPSEANQLGGERPVRRWTFTVGKLGISDLFDDNDWSHDPRSQFLNWADWTAGAWDYPADTRGYTWLAAVEYDAKECTVRFAAAAEPKEANGLEIDKNLRESHSFVLELDHAYALAGREGVARFIVFYNRARMRSYRDAVSQAGSEPPDVTSTRQPGRTKWGGVLNFQQSLGEGLGLFVRGSLNDGRNEAWAYAEIDRSVTVGVVRKAPVSSRPRDETGLAMIVNGLSAPHRDYLAAGGYGFMIGDGRLDYGLEEIAELYYQASIIKGVWFTPDYQFVRHPAYNRDRGPVHVFGLRLHVEL